MRSLRWPFVVSLLLHLALLAGFRPRVVLLPDPPRVVLQARLLPAAPAVGDAPVANAVTPRASRSAPAHFAAGPAAKTRTPVPASPPAEVPTAPTQRLSTASILAAAREIGRADEAASRRDRQRDEPALLDRPVQAELAKALAGHDAATRMSRFANGMIKVTTAAGTTYCLLPPPSAVQGSLPLTVVAVTCP